MKDSNIIEGTLEELIAEIALYVKSIFNESVKKRGEFRIALSGGSSMDVFAKAFLNKDAMSSMDWSKWQVFWADERWLAPTNEDSNYFRSKSVFLDYAGIPSKQIHPYETTLKPPDSALAYEEEIRNIFGSNLDEIPRFDLIVLGIGEDGHTASLFPNHPILEEKERLVSYLVDSPKPPLVRMTFSLPLINNAHHIAFVASGSEKKMILKELVKNNLPINLPAKMVSLNYGEIKWFLYY